MGVLSPRPSAAGPFLERDDSKPKRRKTSEQVTKMERPMRRMIIHVKPRFELEFWEDGRGRAVTVTYDSFSYQQWSR